MIENLQQIIDYANVTENCWLRDKATEILNELKNQTK